MNTTGARLLSAAILAGDSAALFGAKREWFSEQELPAYDFVVGHHRRYGELPTIPVVLENGHSIPRRVRSTECAYLLDRLKERWVYEYATDRNPDYLEAVNNRNVEAMGEVLRDVLLHVNALDSGGHVSNLLDDAIERAGVLRSMMVSGALVGITTGYSTLDGLLGGFRKGGVYAVVGRPNAGKSWFLLEMMRQAWDAGESPLFVTMEMSKEQMTDRLLTMDAGTDSQYIQTGQFTTQAIDRLEDTAEGYRQRPALRTYVGTASTTVADLDGVALEMGATCIYIDAAYLMSPTRNRRRSSRREYLVDMIEELKELAVLRDVPLVFTTQLNRQAPRQESGRTRLDLSMIAETDTIGQIASGVIGLVPSATNTATRTLDLMKNRDGPIGRLTTHFQLTPAVDLTEISGQGDYAAQDDDLGDWED